MGAEEEGTHPHLKAHFGQLVYPRINNHGGRIVKNTGDVLPGGISECSRGGAMCCRIQPGIIPIGLSSIATISIFAHWPVALLAEATT